MNFTEMDSLLNPARLMAVNLLFKLKNDQLSNVQ